MLAVHWPAQHDAYVLVWSDPKAATDGVLTVGPWSFGLEWGDGE